MDQTSADVPDVEAAAGVGEKGAQAHEINGVWQRLRQWMNVLLFGEGQAGGIWGVDVAEDGGNGGHGASPREPMEMATQPSYLKRSRTYTRHKGNNNFFFRGHCDTIQGPGTRGIVITFLLIAVPSGVALGLVGNRLIDVSPAFEIILAIWTAVTLSCFALTAVTYVPKTCNAHRSQRARSPHHPSDFLRESLRFSLGAEQHAQHGR